MGIEETAVDHYESLKQRLWTIPTESIVKTTDSIGSGNFGIVLKGYIQRGESKIEAALHIIEGIFKERNYFYYCGKLSFWFFVELSR
jgi:hypothetical protein